MDVCPAVFTLGCVTRLLWAEVSPVSVWETSPGSSACKDISCPEPPSLGPTAPLPMAPEQGWTHALSPCLSHVAHRPVPGPWLVDWIGCRPDPFLRVFLMLTGLSQPCCCRQPCSSEMPQDCVLSPRWWAPMYPCLPLRAALFLWLLTPDTVVCLPWQDFFEDRILQVGTLQSPRGTLIFLSQYLDDSTSNMLH